MWGREPLAFFHWIKLSFFPFSLYWVGQKIVHVFHKTVWQIQVNFLANPIFFLRLRRRKIRSTWYLTQQEEASQTDPSTRKILKRMIHTISYKEGLKSDLSVRCGNMEDFDFFFFFQYQCDDKNKNFDRSNLYGREGREGWTSSYLSFKSLLNIEKKSSTWKERPLWLMLVW